MLPDPLPGEWSIRPPDDKTARGTEATPIHQAPEAGFHPVSIRPDERGEPLVLNHQGWLGELVATSAP